MCEFTYEPGDAPTSMFRGNPRKPSETLRKPILLAAETPREPFAADRDCESKLDAKSEVRTRNEVGQQSYGHVQTWTASTEKAHVGHVCQTWRRPSPEHRCRTTVEYVSEMSWSRAGLAEPGDVPTETSPTEVWNSVPVKTWPKANLERVARTSLRALKQSGRAMKLGNHFANPLLLFWTTRAMTIGCINYPTPPGRAAGLPDHLPQRPYGSAIQF